MSQSTTEQPIILTASSASEFLRGLYKERNASRERTQALNAQISAVEKAQRTGEPVLLDSQRTDG